MAEAPFYFLSMLAQVSNYGIYAELASASGEHTCINATKELHECHDRLRHEHLGYAALTKALTKAQKNFMSPKDEKDDTKQLRQENTRRKEVTRVDAVTGSSLTAALTGKSRTTTTGYDIGSCAQMICEVIARNCSVRQNCWNRPSQHC